LEIHTLDLGFQGTTHAIAAYLVVGPGGPILVETGPASTTAALEARLADHGVAVTDIRHALVTHIHLDHAGGAGWLARQGTRIYVHHAGAPHLVDPARLLSSAARIYGGDMDRLWGATLPVPADRVTALAAGEEARVGGLTLRALDTPGHAVHHLTFRLGDVAFTGDAAGVRLPGESMVALPAPPPEFDLTAWDRTLARLAGERFARVYPTHFGPFDDVVTHLAQLRDILHASAAFVQREMATGRDRDALVARYTDWNRERAAAAGVSEGALAAYELANPLFMSVDGIMRYWRKQAG